MASKVYPFFKNNNVYSKTIVIFFKLIHVVFGLDFGFIHPKSHIFKYVIKIFTLLQCFVFILLPIKEYLNILTEVQLVWYFLGSVQYTLYGIILLILRSNSTLYSFRMSLQQIDMSLKDDSAASYVDIRQIFGMFLCVFYRLVIVVIFCTMYSTCLFRSAWTVIMYFASIMALDIVMVAIIFIFYSVHRRLVILSSLVKHDNGSVAPFNYIYKSIVEIIEAVKKTYEPVYFVAIIFNVPEVMLSIFYTVAGVKESGGSSILPFLLKTATVKVLVSLTVTLAPALCAGMLSSQTDQLKIILHDKLLQEEDKIKSRAMKKFISYVEARPLKFTVYKMIPLDFSLLGIILNFCVTYLIVIIQFTHLY